MAASGHHWHHEIIHMLIQGSAEYHEGNSRADLIEWRAIEKEGNPPNSTEPRVFFTHLMFHHLPRQVKRHAAVQSWFNWFPWLSNCFLFCSASSLVLVPYGGRWLRCHERRKEGPVPLETIRQTFPHNPRRQGKKSPPPPLPPPPLPSPHPQSGESVKGVGPVSPT